MTKAVKRSVSIVLTILMLMSMCVIGSFTGTAATTNDETVGVSYDGTTKLYLDSNGCYWWNDADAVMGVSFRGSTTTTPVAMTPVEGRTKIFEVTVPAGDYTQVVFSRHESIESAAWNSVTATLQSDRNLFVLNSGANGGSWDNFDEGATDPPVVYGPQTIYFDNTNTRWSEVYVYGWAFGLSETFEKMELVEGNIYSYTFPEEPVAGQEGFLFVNKGSWTSQQQQTVNVMLEEGKNLYTNLSGSGTTWSGTWDVYTPVTTDPTEPEPTEPEPTEPEPTEPEPTEPEPTEPEPTEPEPTEPEPTEPEPTEPEPTEPEPTEPEDTIIVYYSPSQAWRDAGYTVKANAQGSMELWTQVDMTNTDETINGQPVYKAEFAMDAAPYGGFDTLQFQAYNGSQWIEQVVAISSWATTDTFNGKYYNGAGWVDYVPDSEIDPTEPEPTEPEPTEPEPTEPEPTEPEPTEPEPTEPPVETITVSFDNTATNWSTVKAYAYNSETEENMGWPGIDASTTEGNVSQFQIEKGKYDTIIFNNGADEQTISVALEADKTYVATTQTGTRWYIEGIEPNNITVYFTNNKNWDSANIYLYDGGFNNTWPGQPMTFVQQNSMGQDVYSYTFDANLYTTVIFTDGQTSAQETVSITNPTDMTGYYLLDEMEGAKFKVGEYGVFTVQFFDTTEDPAELISEQIVFEGESAIAPTMPVMKDKEYVAGFAPQDLTNITEDKTFTYSAVVKSFTVQLIANDATVSIEGGIDGTNVFNYGDVVTLTCTDPNFAYWEINGQRVSYNSAYKFIVTADYTVEAVKTEGGMVYPEPDIFIDDVIYDTATDPSKILMYFGIHTLNPGEGATYGIFRYVGEAPADAQTAIQDYLDNGTGSAYNSYIKDYTDSGYMNSDGRYNYVASVPVGVDENTVVTVYAFVVVGEELFISEAVTAMPATLS